MTRIPQRFHLYPSTRFKRMRAASALCLIVSGALFATIGLRAETHRFVPTTYYSTLSSEHAPALRIKSGDRVVTSTVDNSGKEVSLNPLTGPFYIEGAEPG